MPLMGPSYVTTQMIGYVGSGAGALHGSSGHAACAAGATAMLASTAITAAVPNVFNRLKGSLLLGRPPSSGPNRIGRP